MKISQGLFKRCLYSLVAVDVLMLSLFYLRLSQLSYQELVQGRYIGYGIGLLPSYIFWIFLIYASITTYRHSVFEEQFSQSPQFGRFVDKIVSVAMPILILMMIVREWPQ